MEWRTTQLPAAWRSQMVDSGKKSVEKQWKWNGESTRRVQLGDPRFAARGSGCAAQWNGEWKLKFMVF